MLGSSPVIAFVSTADMSRARDFYGAVLGLRLMDEGVYACAYDAGGTQLRVTAVDTVSPQPYTVLGWSVVDIATTVQALASGGVQSSRSMTSSKETTTRSGACSASRTARTFALSPPGAVFPRTFPKRRRMTLRSGIPAVGALMARRG